MRMASALMGITEKYYTRNAGEMQAVICHLPALIATAKRLTNARNAIQYRRNFINTRRRPMSLLTLLEKQSKAFILFLTLALIALIGLIDYRTGYEIGSSITYLLPIMLAAWVVGMWWGIAASIVCAGTWLWADVASGHAYSSGIIMLWSGLMRLGFFLLLTYSTATIKRMLEREQELARTDPLTGLLNRRAFYEQAAMEVQRIRRFFRPFTIIYLDMDGFKTINDTFGHDTGDDLLVDVASVLRANTRAVDIAARMGGDEFALLIPDVGTENARPVAEKLQKLLLAQMKAGGFPVTFSIGAVSVLAPPPSLDAVMTVADQLVYGVKYGGKNGIQYETYTGEPVSNDRTAAEGDTP
jgi:diguanylate cyclase (GGDEF)-like protein